MKLEDLISQYKQQRFFGRITIEFRAGMPYSVLKEESLVMELLDDSRQNLERKIKKTIN